jgi:enolase
MIGLLVGWLQRYPIVSIGDPLAEDDTLGFIEFTKEVGDRIQIVGDDLLVTQASRVREAALRGAGNAVLLKPNQCGTMTETLGACEPRETLGLPA